MYTLHREGEEYVGREGCGYKILETPVVFKSSGVEMLTFGRRVKGSRDVESEWTMV